MARRWLLNLRIAVGGKEVERKKKCFEKITNLKNSQTTISYLRLALNFSLIPSLFLILLQEGLYLSWPFNEKKKINENLVPFACHVSLVSLVLLILHD